MYNKYLTLTTHSLISVSREFVKNRIFNGLEFPLLDRRVELLRELSQVTIEKFEGKYENIVTSAHKSAEEVRKYTASQYSSSKFRRI